MSATDNIPPLAPGRVTTAGLVGLLKFAIVLCWVMAGIGGLYGFNLATKDSALVELGIVVGTALVAFWMAIAAVLTYLRWRAEPDA